MSETPRLTKQQAAIIGAYTGITCGPFNDIHEYVDSFPQFKGIMTHEFADKSIVEEIREAVKPSFLAICYVETESDSNKTQEKSKQKTKLDVAQERIAELEKALQYTNSGLALAYEAASKHLNDETMLHIGYHQAHIQKILGK